MNNFENKALKEVNQFVSQIKAGEGEECGAEVMDYVELFLPTPDGSILNVMITLDTDGTLSSFQLKNEQEYPEHFADNPELKRIIEAYAHTLYSLNQSCMPTYTSPDASFLI